MTRIGRICADQISANPPDPLLFRPYIPDFPMPTQAWLTLAMSTTMAGSLTLLGSVANLIVAEIACRRDVNFSFTEYLKAGPLITLFSLAIGIAWLVWVF